MASLLYYYTSSTSIIDGVPLITNSGSPGLPIPLFTTIPDTSKHTAKPDSIFFFILITSPN